MLPSVDFTMKPSDFLFDQARCFSSGPCAKNIEWCKGISSSTPLGRSHRSKCGIKKIQDVLTLIRNVLEIPDSYRVALTPGGNTGSIELALWSLLARQVTCIAYDPFGYLWYKDVKEALLRDTKLISSEFGDIPDVKNVIDFNNDLVFVHAATTTAVMFEDLEWIPDDRLGLVFCDAAASAFGVRIPWHKLDVISFAFQKGLGCEANQGVLVISERAWKRFKEMEPRALPRILQMTDVMFDGYTINTPSMLCIGEYESALQCISEQGADKALYEPVLRNKAIIDNWVNAQKYFSHLCPKTQNQSPVNSCLVLNVSNNWDNLRSITSELEINGIAYDVLGHSSSAPCIRIWHGPTVLGKSLEVFLDRLGDLMRRI